MLPPYIYEVPSANARAPPSSWRHQTKPIKPCPRR
nr:MAG TPA: hypothetical protein [Caudoviricetes sp.]